MLRKYSGVPKGSILGPNIFINEQPNHMDRIKEYFDTVIRMQIISNFISDVHKVFVKT